MTGPADPHQREQAARLWAAPELTQDLDLARLAQRVVEGVIEVTDFSVATLTIRDGDTCRRIAAAGVEDPRIGLETPYATWRGLLREEHRAATACFVIPPQASETHWVQTVPVLDVDATDGRDLWTAEHGLIVELVDTGGACIGLLSVDAPRSGLLPSDDEFEPLELFAHQAQTALRNARLHEEVLRQRDAAEALNTVGRAVSASLELREVLRLCCDAVLERSVGDRVSIYLHEPATGAFRTVMSQSVQPDRDLWEAFKALPPATIQETPVFGEVLRTGHPVLVERVSDEHVRARVLELFSLKSLAAYPLRWHSETVGILVVDTFGDHIAFPPHEVEIVSRIAAQAAVAIEQAQLHETARANAVRADELYELTKQMTRTFDFDAVFERIVEAVTSRTDAYAVGLMEVEGDEVVLLRTNIDADGGPLPYERIPVAALPDEFWDRLGEEGSVRIDDVGASGLGGFVPEGARSLLLAGHHDDGRLRLVLHVSSGDRRVFTRDDGAFVEGLVEVAALALRNARLYEQVRRNAERDGLTGLKNRRMYGEEVPDLLAGADEQHPVVLAVLDIDDFKAVNDRHGHAAGDEALVHVADRIGRSIRASDRAYRFGGE
ncbi:MAG: sensor domain-containing diguanylate cyclase, partial [Dehalococcoidia bacterium]